MKLGQWLEQRQREAMLDAQRQQMTHHMQGVGSISPQYAPPSQFMGQAREFLADLTPGVGDYRAVQRGGDLARQAFADVSGGNLLQGAGKGAESLAEYLSAVPGIGDVATLAKGAVNAFPLAMTAFHGSPHRFDRFDMSKIGTGEGAQAYGHGLYFAENPGVAKEYQHGLSDWTPEGGQVIPGSIDDRAAAFMAESLDARSSNPFSHAAQRARDALGDEAAPILDKLAEWESTGQKFARGNLYEVDIPDDAIAKMLDWDAPLSEQPEAVREALEGMGFGKNDTGAEIYATLQDRTHPASGGFGRDYNRAAGQAASDSLRKAGIPGIRYLDGTSRSAGEGTRNFVVFDDQIPKILKRNESPL